MPTYTWRALGLGALLLVAASLADHWAWEHLRSDRIYEKDWGRLLRILGFLPTWFAGGIALALHDRAPRRGLLLAAAPLLAGAWGELLKLLIRRERPNLHEGAYVFREFADQTFSTRALGLPSTHAIVAFAGAAMASYLFPRTWPVWWTLAIGTALTRVMSGAHFLSDVTLAALAGWLVAWALWRRFSPPGVTVSTPESSPPQ